MARSESKSGKRGLPAGGVTFGADSIKSRRGGLSVAVATAGESSPGPAAGTPLRWPYHPRVTFAAPAESYDRYMGRYSRRLAPLLTEFAGVGPRMRVLDVGC